MFDRFASKIKIEGDGINDLKFFLDWRILKRIDNCQDVGNTIRSLVRASKIGHWAGHEVIYGDVWRSGKMLYTPDVKGMIEVKIQWAKRKLVQMMLIKPNSPFVIMMVDYTENIGLGWAKLGSIKFLVNGHILNGLETPKYLALVGGEKEPYIAPPFCWGRQHKVTLSTELDDGIQ